MSCLAAGVNWALTGICGDCDRQVIDRYAEVPGCRAEAHDIDKTLVFRIIVIISGVSAA